MGSAAVIAGIQIATAVVGTAVAVKSSKDAGDAAEQAGEFNARVAENDSTRAKNAALDAKARGSVNAQAVETRGRQLAALQASQFAAQGIDAFGGTAALALSDTAANTRRDALTMQDNASEEARVANQTADDGFLRSGLLKAEARNAGTAGNLNAFSAGLSGVSKVSGKWNTYNNTFNKKENA
tara:strand:+ start:12810 stop:13358 length:549 start_codon:yes stop_codon:yes gene_type:complete